MIAGDQGQAIDGACIIATALPISIVQLVLVVSDKTTETGQLEAEEGA
ncbi:hypothetical protein [Ruegeria lacuscaerulensis]|nr:hypothetical protein [Ruegeria lacuscaerulensis]